MPSLPAPGVVRVQDYLNDKLQTLADLDTLDSLLSSVQTQQQQLCSQLGAADSAVEFSRAALNSHSQKLAATINDFQNAQAGTDRRLLAIGTADTATNAAEQFEAMFEKLRRLDVARGYVDLLQKVQELSEDAKRHMGQGNPEEALKPYAKLQELARGLKSRNEAAESAAVHLVDYVEKATGELWKAMNAMLVSKFEQVLAKIKWPAEDVVMPKAVEAEFREAFEKLLVLQGPDLQAGAKEPPPLLPFEVLVKPLALRFRYHFEGDRPTNRIDKPEWFLAHLTGLVATYSASFLPNVVQPILSASPNPLIIQRYATVEFITALLPVMRRKVKHFIPQIFDQAPLLSHFIHEMIKFDAELREEFYYTPFGQYDVAWKGMAHEVLVVENGFAGWLKVEKEFALTRYHTILATPDAWVLDYDSVEPSESKPTKSAMRLKDLLETVTDSYRPLISFSQRLRFLIDIQIAILDQYHDRLNSSVEAFRVLSSSIARAVQGTSKEEVQSLAGLGGLERLCKAYGSAMFMENCMRDWSEDIFFLELWEDLQTRVAKSTPHKHLAGTMNIAEVASITSASLISDSGDLDGALFDETANSYKSLRQKTEGVVVDHLVAHVKDELKSYLKINNWASLDPTLSYLPSPTVSPELLTALTVVATHSSFLKRTLAPAVHRRVMRATNSQLQLYLWDYVLVRHTFSLAGGRQFARDAGELFTEEGAERMKEACVLLTLPTEKGEEEVGWALEEMVKPVFEDNVKARDVMGKLGIVVLGVSEVREVLKRRVEAFGQA